MAPIAGRKALEQWVLAPLPRSHHITAPLGPLSMDVRRRRGPPKTVPQGPCANLTCPHGLFVGIRCECAGTEGAHSIFHAGCTASSASSPHLVDDTLGTTLTSSWPSPKTLRTGRACSDSQYRQCHAGQLDAHADLRWRGVGPAMDDARERAGLQLLPENICLCGDCWVLVEDLRRKDDEATRARAQQIVSEHIDMLPDVLLATLSAWVTMRVFLRQPGGSAENARRNVWLKPEGEERAVGGVVLLGGPAGKMAAAVRGATQFAIAACATARLGARAVLSAVRHCVPSSYWAESGAAFRAELRPMMKIRLRRIRKRTLHALTSFKEDWDTLPTGPRTFVVNATATQRETLESRPLSLRRSQQQFRSRYSVMMMILHGINPELDQPLHAAMHRMAFYGGDTHIFRKFCIRMNMIGGEETARCVRIWQSEESTDARKMYVRLELANGCYFLLAVDNLDWAAMRTALHQYECSKGDQGRHILNRMVFALKTTPEIRALPDEWGLWKRPTG